MQKGAEGIVVGDGKPEAAKRPPKESLDSKGLQRIPLIEAVVVTGSMMFQDQTSPQVPNTDQYKMQAVLAFAVVLDTRLHNKNQQEQRGTTLIRHCKAYILIGDDRG